MAAQICENCKHKHDRCYCSPNSICDKYEPVEMVTRKTFKPSITSQYKYCPMCGNYLYDASDEVDVIWNERNMQELCD